MLGQLAWAVGGMPTCAGCGAPLDPAESPALLALCPTCYAWTARRAWDCCDRVSQGVAPLCDRPLQFSQCQPHRSDKPSVTKSGPSGEEAPFTAVPTCLHSHVLAALWFGSGRVRICVLPALWAGAAVAASGALVAQEYSMRGRLAFLADWQPVMVAVKDKLQCGTTNIVVNFNPVPPATQLREESALALREWLGARSNKNQEINNAMAETAWSFFAVIEEIGKKFDLALHAKSSAPTRYFLPRVFPPSLQSLLLTPGDQEAPCTFDANTLSHLTGTCVGAWGPWGILRAPGGRLNFFDITAIIGRFVAGNPANIEEAIREPEHPDFARDFRSEAGEDLLERFDQAYSGTSISSGDLTSEMVPAGLSNRETDDDGDQPSNEAEVPRLKGQGTPPLATPQERRENE